MTGPVIVGVDGSDDSIAAAAYAAAVAEHHHTSLALVHGYLHPVGYGALGFNPYSVMLPDPRVDAENMLAKAAAKVRADHPRLEVTYRQVALGGASALITESRTADAVVVGHRGVGGFAELLLGSTGSQVAAYASGPVIVVRPRSVGGPVIVGVDGSPGCRHALEFGFTEAAARGLPLLAVHVHVEATAADAAAAEALLDAAVAPWLALYPGVAVRQQVRPASDAEQALIEASGEASLMVVGSRGRGGFAGLILGSVSQALVHHAHCPIAVVHPR